MVKQQTQTKRTGPRPTPRPGEQRHLESADKLQERQKRSKSVKTAAYVLGAATLFSLGVGAANKGLEAGKNYSKERTEKILKSAPNAGEICVIEAAGLTSKEVSTLRIADEFADGTTDIQEFASDASQVLAANQGEGLAVCRPADSEKLSDNHVVPVGNVPKDAVVDEARFDEAGGISHDIG